MTLKQLEQTGKNISNLLHGFADEMSIISKNLGNHPKGTALIFAGNIEKNKPHVIGFGEEQDLIILMQCLMRSPLHKIIISTLKSVLKDDKDNLMELIEILCRLGSENFRDYNLILSHGDGAVMMGCSFEYMEKFIKKVADDFFTTYGSTFTYQLSRPTKMPDHTYDELKCSKCEKRDNCVIYKDHQILKQKTQ